MRKRIRSLTLSQEKYTQEEIRTAEVFHISSSKDLTCMGSSMFCLLANYYGQERLLGISMPSLQCNQSYPTNYICGSIHMI